MDYSGTLTIRRSLREILTWSKLLRTHAGQMELSFYSDDTRRAGARIKATNFALVNDTGSGSRIPLSTKTANIRI